MHYQPKQDLLNDRIILVTGASDGIGREAAMTYARYGATVILLGRNEEKLRQVASHINEETGRQPQWFILDLLTCTSEDCQQLAQRITVNYPRLDGVLHNAGLLGDVCPMSEQNPQVWQDVIQVNVNATFMLTQALLPLLLKSDSRFTGLYFIKRWTSGTSQLGRICSVEICHRRDDAGTGR